MSTSPSSQASQQQPAHLVNAVMQRPRHRTGYHIAILGISLCILVAAVLLETLSDGRVALKFANGFVLPESCYSKVWLGLECPGCGLTRSFVAFASGDLVKSFEHHRMGWAVMLLVLSQIPYRLWALFSPQRIQRVRRFGVAAVLGIAVALWGNWLLDLVIAWLR